MLGRLDSERAAAVVLAVGGALVAPRGGLRGDKPATVRLLAQQRPCCLTDVPRKRSPGATIDCEPALAAAQKRDGLGDVGKRLARFGRAEGKGRSLDSDHLDDGTAVEMYAAATERKPAATTIEAEAARTGSVGGAA